MRVRVRVRVRVKVRVKVRDSQLALRVLGVERRAVGGVRHRTEPRHRICSRLLGTRQRREGQAVRECRPRVEA